MAQLEDDEKSFERLLGVQPPAFLDETLLVLHQQMPKLLTPLVTLAEKADELDPMLRVLLRGALPPLYEYYQIKDNTGKIQSLSSKLDDLNLLDISEAEEELLPQHVRQEIARRRQTIEAAFTTFNIASEDQSASGGGSSRSKEFRAPLVKDQGIVD